MAHPYPDTGYWVTQNPSGQVAILAWLSALGGKSAPSSWFPGHRTLGEPYVVVPHLVLYSLAWLAQARRRLELGRDRWLTFLTASSSSSRPQDPVPTPSPVGPWPFLRLEKCGSQPS